MTWRILEMQRRVVCTSGEGAVVKLGGLDLSALISVSYHCVALSMLQNWHLVSTFTKGRGCSKSGLKTLWSWSSDWLSCLLGAQIRTVVIGNKGTCLVLQSVGKNLGLLTYEARGNMRILLTISFSHIEECAPIITVETGL